MTDELCEYLKLVDLGVLSSKEYHEVFGLSHDDDDTNTVLTPTGLVPLSRLSEFFD